MDEQAASSSVIARLHQLVATRLGRSIAALSLVRAVDQFMPLLIVPYLARVLDPAGWGLVAIAQSLAVYGIITVQYGFAFAGTRAVAQERGDAGRLAELVAGILAAQLLLGVLVGLGAAVVGHTVPEFAHRPALLLSTLAFALAQGLHPFWYFMGQERVGLIAGLSVGGKLLATVAIFVLVAGPGDEWIVLASFACGTALAAMAGYGLIIKEIRPARPGLDLIRRTLRLGFNLFVVQLAEVIHTSGNTFLLGLLVAPAQVAVFAAGEKLCRPVAWLFLPVNVALMSHLSNLIGERPDQAQRLAGLSILLLGAAGLACALVIGAAAPWLVAAVFGAGFEEAVKVMRIMAAIIPLMIVNAALITDWMIPNGLDRALNLVIVSSTGLNVALVLAIAPHHGAEGMAWVTIAVAAYSLAGLLIAMRWHGVWPRLPQLGAGLRRRSPGSAAAAVSAADSERTLGGPG